MKKVENLEANKREMEALVEKLQQWDYEYYILDNPTVADATYDAQLRTLKKLEIDSQFALVNSPTRKLNSAIYKDSKFKLVKREKPMLSIDNVNNLTELTKFDNKLRKDLGRKAIDYLCELKIDGLSASLIYRSSKLVQITTRGDGYTGEDVTFNKDVISNLPSALLTINGEVDFEVRGEIYMRKSDFLQVNEELVSKGLKELSNARNGAAGTLRTLVPNKSRKLNFLAYQLLAPGLATQQQCLELLTQQGFAVSDHRFCQGIEEVVDYLTEIETSREQLPFAIDGVVIKVNRYEDHVTLGTTNKFPRWAIAYKFSAQTALTKIESIVTEVSKNGRLSYVAIVTPVQLDGSQISKVTLHNFAFIEKKFLNISDEILVKKAGDIIPQVAEVIKRTDGFWVPPSTCSSCYQSLTWNSNHLYQLCLNKACPEKNINYLIFFASKAAMNIKGISGAIVAKLYEANLVTKPQDFYDLENKQAQLLALEGFKTKTVTNILASIARSRYQELSKVVAAFSIPLLSSVKARKFSSLLGDDAVRIVAFVENADFLLVKEQLGTKTAEAMNFFFSEPINVVNFRETLRAMRSD